MNLINTSIQRYEDFVRRYNPLQSIINEAISSNIPTPSLFEKKHIKHNIHKNKKLIIPEGTIATAPFCLDNVPYDIDEIVFPSSLLTIGDYLFGNLTRSVKHNISTKYIKISGGEYIECIGKHAFKSPNNTINTPYVEYDFSDFLAGQNIHIIEDLAFENCISDTLFSNISYFPYLTKIGHKAFKNSGIKKLTSSAALDFVGGECFKGSTINHLDLSRSINIKYIYDQICANTKNIKTAVFPDSVISMSRAVFNSSYIQQFNIPPKVTEIPCESFFNCRYLRSVTSQGKISYIGDNAFRNDISLESLFPINDTTFGKNPLIGCAKLSKHSPHLTDYKNISIK